MSNHNPSGKKADLIPFYARRANWGGWILVLFIAAGVLILNIDFSDYGSKSVLALAASAVLGHLYLAVCQVCAEVVRLREISSESKQ